MEILIDRSSVKQRLRGALAGKVVPPVYRADPAGQGVLEDYGRFIAAHYLGISGIAIGESHTDHLDVERWVDRGRNLLGEDLRAMSLHPPDNVTWREYHPLAVGFVIGFLRLGLQGMHAAGRFALAKVSGASTAFVEDEMAGGRWPNILKDLTAIQADSEEGREVVKDSIALIEAFRVADDHLHAGEGQTD